ncbi:hypothetical protein Q7P37_000403 [Cladosporium fusiforme]
MWQPLRDGQPLKQGLGEVCGNGSRRARNCLAIAGEGADADGQEQQEVSRIGYVRVAHGGSSEGASRKGWEVKRPVKADNNSARPALSCASSSAVRVCRTPTLTIPTRLSQDDLLYHRLRLSHSLEQARPSNTRRHTITTASLSALFVARPIPGLARHPPLIPLLREQGGPEPPPYANCAFHARPRRTPPRPSLITPFLAVDPGHHAHYEIPPI